MTTPTVIVIDAACPHCGTNSTTILAALEEIRQQQGEVMSALTDLQAADAALKAEVATFLADVATALSAENPDIEAVVSDLNAEVTQLQAADPAAAAPPAPPAG